MRIAVVVVLLVLLLAAPSFAEDEPGIAIPVPSWTPAPSSPPVFGPPEVVLRLPDVAPVERPQPDLTPFPDTAEGLAALLEDEVRAAGGVIEEGEGVLRVAGSREAVGLARRRVEDVTSFLTGRSVVSVEIVAMPEDAADGSWNADEVSGVAAASPERLLWTGRFELRRGEGGLQEDLTERSFIVGHSAEVAQEASVSEPVLASLRTGARVYVSCRPTSGPEAFLTLSIGLSEGTDALRTVETASGVVDLPEVPFLSLTTSFWLTAGGGQVVRLDGPLGARRLALVLRLVDGGEARDLPFDLVDLATLVGHPDAIDAVPSLAVGVTGGVETRPGGYDDAYGPASGALREEAMASLVEAIEATDAEVVALSPSVVAITGPDDVRRRARGVLERADRRGRVARQAWRTPWAELARMPGFDAATGSMDPDALAKPGGEAPGAAFVGQLTTPVAARTPLLLAQGTWRRFLQGTAVEIAQAACVVRPVVGTHVAGERIVVRPHETSGGSNLRLEREASYLLELAPRDLEVKRDLMGERADLPGHVIDMLRTADTRATLRLDPRGASLLDHAGEDAVIHVFSD